MNLEPIDYSIYAYHELKEKFDIYFLTAPCVRNPISYIEKRMSIEKYFGLEACKKLIICDYKNLVKGDFLVDDNIFGNGQENFEGKLIHFGSQEFSNWLKVLDFFETV